MNDLFTHIFILIEMHWRYRQYDFVFDFYSIVVCIGKIIHDWFNISYMLHLLFVYIVNANYWPLGKKQKDTSQCLKITEKISFKIASKASYIYILNGQRFIKNAQNSPFWRKEL